MDHRHGSGSVMLAWLGTLSTFVMAELIQLWVGIIAGCLTIIYTGLRIWDWFKEKRRKRMSFHGPHS